MYKEVYDAWKKERATTELRPIQRNFFDDVLSYIDGLKNRIETTTNELLAEIWKKELYYTIAMVKDLILLRFKKLLQIIFEESGKPDFEKLSDFELKIAAHLLEISKIINDVLDALSKGKKITIKVEDKNLETVKEIVEVGEVIEDKKAQELPKESEAEEYKTEYITIRIKEDLPEITGIDLNRYGPFKKGDIVKLPKDNALALVNDNLADFVKLQQKEKEIPQD